MRKETEVNVYRKIPVKIRAIKFDGTNAKESNAIIGYKTHNLLHNFLKEKGWVE